MASATTKKEYYDEKLGWQDGQGVPAASAPGIAAEPVKSSFKDWELEQARRVIAAEPVKAPGPLTFGKIVFGVFLGNLLTAIVCGIAYELIINAH